MRDARSPIDGILSPFGVLMGSVAFSPLTLFAMSESGVWYDPLDLTTLFQDSAGTTPVTAAAQPDGLTLDKSRGSIGTNGAFRRNLVVYSEDFGTFVWTKINLTASVHNIADPDGGFTASTLTATASIGYFFYNAGPNPTSGSTAPSLWIRRRTGSGDIRLRTNAGAGTDTPIAITSSWQRISVVCAASTGNCWVLSLVNSGDAVDIWHPQLELGSTATAYQRINADWPSTMAGIHAAQASATFKPAYQATPQRLQFDGSDDRLPFAYNPTTSGSLAVRINGTTASRVVMGSQAATDGRAFIALAADGSLGAGIGTQSTSTIKGATDIRGVWTTGVVTWNGTTVRLYQNGVEVYSGAQSGAVNTTVPLRVGCLNSNGTDGAFWAGGIGAAIALGRVMTPAEISSLHTLWSTIQ